MRRAALKWAGERAKNRKTDTTQFGKKFYLCNMFELAQHIKVLLLHQSCVIIPNFGGFVTSYVPARYEEEKHTFLPPRRIVAFNPSLTVNDGLLVQSYMQTYHVSYNEAAARVDEAVKAGKQELKDKGELTLKGIGHFKLLPNGQYDFTEDETGIFSIPLYGLTPFYIDSIRESNISAVREEKREKKSYTLRINRELANYVATAAIAILFYFIWSSPVADAPRSVAEQQSYSAFCPAPVAPQLQTEKEATHRNETPVPARQVREAIQSDTIAGPAETGAGAQSMPDGAYTIVMVSRVTLKNAERYTRMLEMKGIQGATVYAKGKMVRVVYGRYNDEDEAYAALRQLRKAHSPFADAWVLKLD